MPGDRSDRGAKKSPDVLATLRARTGRLSYPLFLSLASLLAALAAAYFFTPRFVYWRALHLPDAPRVPEIHRAIDTLRQLEDPFGTVDESVNAVIRWRLLFPLLARALHLPEWLYLALPFLGCLLALAWIVHVVARETGDRLQAAATAALLATCSWFSVSLGWLMYFDSWFVLGLLVVSFTRSTAALAIAALLTPWIDERFVLSLPMAMVARAAVSRSGSNAPRGSLVRDSIVCLLAVSPYVGIRFGAAMTGRDPQTGAYLASHAENLGAPLWRRVWGLWEGLRCAWIFVVALVASSSPRLGPRWRAIAGAVTVLSVVGSSVIAGDFSRSASMAVPLAVAGVVLARERGWGRYGVAAALGANLVLPATHVIVTFSIPVFYLPYEIDQLRNPPAELNPAVHVRQGLAYHQAGDLARARAELEAALRLDADHPDALYLRGNLRANEGDLAGATEDIERSLQHAPRDWPHRSRAEALLVRLRLPGADRTRPGTGDPPPE